MRHAPVQAPRSPCCAEGLTLVAPVQALQRVMQCAPPRFHAPRSPFTRPGRPALVAPVDAQRAALAAGRNLRSPKLSY
jgi:hypothetical protein